MIRTLLQWPAKTYLKQQLINCNFSIISNDCYGAEIYRWIDRPYNTPFVGLMVMAPCYISFLQNFEHNIYQELKFEKGTKYPSLENFWFQRSKYPIGLINGTEIHFLHYHSEKDAYEKWNRRKDRIDFNNLRFKFCLGKDFATIEHLRAFDLLSYPFKICFGEDRLNDFHSYASIPALPIDGAASFRHSLQYIDIIKWLNKGSFKFENIKEELFGKFLSMSLKK
jgi:uncharacterized protein (DUF1919 family)